MAEKVCGYNNFSEEAFVLQKCKSHTSLAHNSVFRNFFATKNSTSDISKRASSRWTIAHNTLFCNRAWISVKRRYKVFRGHQEVVLKRKTPFFWSQGWIAWNSKRVSTENKNKRPLCTAAVGGTIHGGGWQVRDTAKASWSLKPQRKRRKKKCTSLQTVGLCLQVKWSALLQQCWNISSGALDSVSVNHNLPVFVCERTNSGWISDWTDSPWLGCRSTVYAE